MRALRKAGRVLSILLTVVLAIPVIFNVYTLVARKVTGDLQPSLFGFSTAVVISGSMSGMIEVDDMIVIRQQKEYAVGDVITFRSGDSLVTHQIVRKEGLSFITKGIANNTEDPRPVDRGNIVGKVILVIPGVGKVVTFVRTPLGMLLVVLAGFGLVVGPSYLERAKEEKRSAAEEEADN